jgi:hypothetical protein
MSLQPPKATKNSVFRELEGISHAFIIDIISVKLPKFLNQIAGQLDLSFIK